MTSLLLGTQEVQEERRMHIADGPITFEQFLELTGEDDDIELVNGVLVEKMATQLDHEWLFAWLLQLIGIYVENLGLGIVLGSRTAVEISEFDGRLPDLLFVREERRSIVQQKAIYGAPDLVMEIVSPNDRRSDIIELETDYRRIGVPEIVFIERRKRRLRILRLRETGYEETVVAAGPFALESIAGLTLQAEWLLQEPRPAVYDTLTALLESKGSARKEG